MTALRTAQLEKEYPFSSFFCSRIGTQLTSKRPPRGFRICKSRVSHDVALLQLFYTVAYLAIFCGCTAQFVSDLDGNPKDWFSHKEAHLLQLCMKILDAERFFCVQIYSILYCKTFCQPHIE